MTAVHLTSIDPLRPVLSARPLGLFSDIDGTLSPIVDQPEDARVTPRCRELLTELMRLSVQVAFITGRQLVVAQAMVGLDHAAFGANHGLELWVDGMSGVKGGGGDYYALVEQVGRETEKLAALGVTIEPKGQGIAFHYRQAPDEGSAVAGIREVIGAAPAASGFHPIEGRKVIELRPDITASKGTATLELAGRLGVAGIVCVGDDRTDVDMFRAAASLASQNIESCSVAVMSPEIHPEVLEAADYSVDGVGGVERLLDEIAEVVRQTAA